MLDFFGVPVKAQEVLGRVQELTLLGKRIKRFKDPVAQFRLKSHPRIPSWSKACAWTQGNKISYDMLYGVLIGVMVIVNMLMCI